MAEKTIKVGESPLPGITLQQALPMHKSRVRKIAWAPNGNLIASAISGGEIDIWDIKQGEIVKKFEGKHDLIHNIDWAPNSDALATQGDGRTTRIWNLGSDNHFEISDDYTPFTDEDIYYGGVTWVNDGKRIAYVLHDTSTIRFWDIQQNKSFLALQNYWRSLRVLSSPQQHLVPIVSHYNKWSKLLLLDTDKYELLEKAYIDGNITAAYWLHDGSTLVIGLSDKSVQILNLNTQKVVRSLEGHTEIVVEIKASKDLNLLATRSKNNIVILWDLETWEPCARLQNKGDFHSLDFHPHGPYLATTGENGHTIHIWNIDKEILTLNKLTSEIIHYTTAKLVLVGDSGVGKTGLGWRLAHKEFKEHSSTHGQQFWIIPELGLKRKDGTECEAVLWDLAGQPDYRLVHSLYLDDVSTALVLFDPSNRQEPLAGVDFWLNQLKNRDKSLRNTILVGARTDRGTSTLTDAEIQAYCERNGISGGYISTSALKGDGLPELLEKLKAQLPWDQMTTTVTTATFKRIKEFVLSLKEKADRKGVLIKPNDLQIMLASKDKNWNFSGVEMMTAVGHLETHGYVKVIHSSNGEHFILIAPDILANLASSIVLEARRNPRGLGVLEEERLLHGEYIFPELANLSKEEGKILLDAAAVLFLERNLCFRETFNNQTFLVFPSLINEKRPVDETTKVEEGASYRVKGAIENVYASLVVLLGYTNTFTRTHQWQNQAQYEMGKGEVCGFIQSEYRNGEIELVLYYDLHTPDPVRLTFRGLLERFLTRRELDISRYQPVICHKCGSPLARNVVMDQLNKNKKFSFCHECGEKLRLPSPEPISQLSRREEVIMGIQQTIAQRRTSFEAALVRVKALLRDQGQDKAPTCFISYAWGTKEHQRWVKQLAGDLRNAGINVLLDQWYVIPGANLDRYIEQIISTDYVVVVGTPGLKQKYNSKISDPVVSAELEMLNLRARQPNKYGHTILPILVEGDSDAAFTPQLHKLVHVDFRQSAYYFRQLFDMIWRMYDLSFDNPLLEELQESMTPPEKP